MANRRVELRNHLSGTGMLNDPDRLQELQEQMHHSELNARPPPKTKFREVLSTPAYQAASKKSSRPLSKKKLSPTGAYGVHPVGFGAPGEDLDDLSASQTPNKIVIKG